MDRGQPHGRIMRLLALGAVLIALTTGYVVMVRQFDVTGTTGGAAFWRHR
jgi:hypothetical protein